MADGYEQQAKDNPGLKGYNRFGEETIERVNRFTDLANELGDMITELSHLPAADQDPAAEFVDGTIDMRFLNIGKTDIQKGVMMVKRAIMQPDNF